MELRALFDGASGLQPSVSMAATFRFASLAVLAALLFVALHIPATAERLLAFDLVREQLGGVDATDGIQQSEARLIAVDYWLLGEVTHCGGPMTPTMIDGAWKAEIVLGFGGERTGAFINVDPTSGGVTSQSGPTYKTLASFRRARLARAVLRGR
jgi:hypothetical protein